MTALETLPVVPAAELEEPQPERRWLVESLWARAGVGIVGGAPKCCKSWLALDLVLSVASNTPVLGRFAVPGPGALGILVPAAGGMAGLLIDSVVGATAQARYRCPACGEEGEVEACTCGAVRRLVGGWRWMTNDTVNVLGTLTGAMVAMVTSIPR